MNPVLQIAVVAASLAVVAIAVVAIRVMIRFEKTANELTKTATAARATMIHAEGMTREIHQLAESFQSVAPHITRVAAQFEDIADRTAGLGHALLDQVEPPVKTAVAVMNGVRTGTRTLFESFTRRVRHRHQLNGNGGNRDV